MPKKIMIPKVGGQSQGFGQKEQPTKQKNWAGLLSLIIGIAGLSVCWFDLLFGVTLGMIAIIIGLFAHKFGHKFGYAGHIAGFAALILAIFFFVLRTIDIFLNGPG